MNTLTITIAVAFVVILLVLTVLLYGRRNQRLSRWLRFGRYVGLDLQLKPSPQIHSLLQQFRTFDGHVPETPMLVGEYEGLRVVVLDYAFPKTLAADHRVMAQTMVCLQGPVTFPFFLAWSEQWLEKVTPVAGVQDLNFSSDLEFSRRFALQGQDHEQLKQFFDANMREAFSRRGKWCFEANHHGVLMYQPERLWEPPQLKRLLHECYEFYRDVAAAVEASR